MTDPCEHSNQPSGSIKCRKFLSWPGERLLASQEGLCFM